MPSFSLALFYVVVAVVVSGAAAQSGSSVPPGQQAPDAAVVAPPEVLRALDVAAATLQTISVPTPTTAVPCDQVAFMLRLGNLDVIVDLVAADVRAPGYQLWQRVGGSLVAIPAGPCTTYRGELRTDASSRVAASLVGGQLRALIVLGGELWSVQPLSDVVPDAGKLTHVVFRAVDSLPRAERCGLTALVSPPTSSALPDSVYECELALEADHALFLLNNSNAIVTQAEVLGIVNAVDVIYQGDLQIAFSVTQLVVDSAPDPYSSSVASVLLGQMRSYWNTNYAALPRDVAHLFTGRAVGAASNGSVGYAYTATVCNTADAYGLSQTRWSINQALRVGLTAHELGHNFGASHCDQAPDCSIMCANIGGCTGVASSFGATSTAVINTYLQSVGCLTLVPSVPQITSASPVLVETVNPPRVTVGGSGFLGTTSMTVGGQTVSASQIQVLSDSQLRFWPPAGLPLGVHPTTVTNPAGTSNATILIYRGADPCQVLTLTEVLPGNPLVWTMGGWPGGTGYLGVGFSDTTQLFQGLPVLDGFILLWAGPLDARGMASFAVPGVPALLSGFEVYSQMLDEPTGTGLLRSVSALFRTLIL